MSFAPASKSELLARLAAGHAVRVTVVTPNRRLAQELARALEREGIQPATGESLPLPRDLGRLLRSRIRSLSGDTRDVLLVVAVVVVLLDVIQGRRLKA